MGREDTRRGRFVRDVRDEARRKQEARRLGEGSFWESLSLLGAVGWMVALPAVTGALVGRWLDAGSGRLTFTLGLMLFGLILGGYTAWTMLWRR